MKVKAVDKFLLVILAIIVIALALAVLGIAIGLITEDMVSLVTALAFTTSLGERIIVGLIGFVLLLIMIRLLIGILGGPREEKPKSALVNTGEVGSVYISLDAVNAMVQRHCRAHAGVKDMTSNVTVVPDGIAISMKLMLSNEASVPAVSGELQSTLKQYVEELSGLTVKDIGILVTVMPQQKTVSPVPR